MKKKGDDFEKLIGWIQESIHGRALIKLDEKIKDTDTGRVRQVDVTIRISDGPTEFFGIIEVRDHKRPIGVSYIEEISGKLRSVKADAAFLISRSGFAKTAIQKAHQLGIRTLTFEEAKIGNWNSWFQCQDMTVLYRKYENAIVYFFEKESDNPINLPSQTLDKFNKDPSTKLILDKDAAPIASIPKLVDKIFSTLGHKPYEKVPPDGSRKRERFFFNANFDPSLWIKTEGGDISQIGKIGIEADIYFGDGKKYPFKLMKYRKTESTSSIAQLATSVIEVSGKKYRFELLAPGANEFVPAGSKLAFRFIELTEDS